MDRVENAIEALKRTEIELGRLVSEAAVSGDYSSVVRIAGWAQALRELGARAKRENEGPVRQPHTLLKKTHKGRRGVGRRSVRLKEQLSPRFLRKGNDLVRVAWSRREKREYQHRAPYGMLQALASAMIENGASSRVFSTDQLLPLRDRADGSEFPSYQVYVGIALLKHTGLIDQHGRQGYSIPRPEALKESAEAVWKELPEK